MVSQFVSSHKVNLLGDIPFDFPEGTHAIGRLDSHSEGLLLLTTNKKITRLLFDSIIPHERVYLVQVKHAITQEAVEILKAGVAIRIKGGVDYVTAPCKAELVAEPGIYFNDCKPTERCQYYSWLLLKLTEGKFHQVRKMVSAVNHQCRRLIRVSIENIKLDNLKPSAVLEIGEEEFFKKLKLTAL